MLFELLNLPAERWLGDIQALGGTGEIECFSHRLKVADMS
jgi:hypothetical protein